VTAVVEPGSADWLAVEFVCNGTPMRLAGDPATLEAAILEIGHMLPVQQIAERCGTHTKMVSVVLRKHHGLPCPICTRILLCPNGVTPTHVESNGWHCDMSGWPINDMEQVTRIRSAKRKLTKRSLVNAT